MRFTNPLLPIDRRRFMVGAAMATSSYSVAACAPGRARAASWIPSPDFVATLPDLMAENVVPGVAIAAIENGAPAWTGVFGLANVEASTPATRETLFEAGSLGKPVFAYVVMKLAEENVISLDQPLTSYFRPNSLADHPWIDRINARHVLSHTSGLVDWREDPDQKLAPAFEPGTQWRYSGEAFYWLQCVLEEILGKGLDAIMQERLLGPAGMRQSTFVWDTEHAAPRSLGHATASDGRTPEVASLQYSQELGERFLIVAERWRKPVSDWTHTDVQRALHEMPPHTHPMLVEAPLRFLELPNYVRPNAAGSLALTVDDYAGFTALMMARASRAAWELRDASREAMLTRQVATNSPSLDWGLGWGLSNTPEGTLFVHSGYNNGQFFSRVIGDAARGQALIVFTNGAKGDELALSILSRVTRT